LSGKNIEDRVPRPKPKAKSVWANVEKSPEEVVQEMFEEALRHDSMTRKTWVVLVNGAPKKVTLIEE